MTEPTTTELLTEARTTARIGWDHHTVARFNALDKALSEGSPLPKQWPQAKELEELREKVGKYEKLLHSFAYGVALDQDDYISDSQEALKP